MGKTISFIFYSFVAFMIMFASISASRFSGIANEKREQRGTTPFVPIWCVVKAGAPASKLQGFLDYACGKADCSAIQYGGTCFEPNTLQSHASFALNQLYKATQFCNTEIGVITNVDPSTANCIYQ